MSEANTEFHSGFLTLVGRPNAGKSTLLNAAVGHKLAITSNVAQTTRRQMRAVVNTDNSQLIIVDTPGLHKPKDALGKELNRATLSALEDVDVIALLIDATQEVGRGDEWVASHVRMANAPHKILLITKADLVDQQTADAQAQAAAQLADFDDVLVVSAKHGFNVKGFIDLASSYLPEGLRWFPEDMDCDLEDEELVAEFVREKAFRNLRQEIPHSLAVSCEDIEWAKDGHGSMVATILVERDGQKGIVIGKGGSMIKKIGTEARRDLERLFGVPIYLDLSVRVQPAWRRDRNEISRLGLVVDE
ncbi:GTPase Era [Atopobium sp. oral taxon 810]|uniref:GTPase Era n=1 Tax=Atopobium sp. oral taxon 810 TaxID=712158 RepID=UPI00039756E5|nr:GTPase Era [Atopobium sp. oral taxon 810]ERI03855.1 ribosome biogenesis GTPase Era [Atopobium sp. oral taxon 810 str. F0209]